MRLRNIKGAKETIAASPYVLSAPEEYRGHWKEYFGNSNPIHMEIGMGKGKFITALASLHPKINYIGVEKYESVLIRAVAKREALPCQNLIFLRYAAEDLCNAFSAAEIERIYLNFSDPWPKDRHAKRRLTSANFLALYRRFLSPEGQVELKTDNRQLFDFSLAQAKACGWTLREITYDLHHSAFAAGNIMTEYEEKFSSLGNPIYRMVSCLPHSQEDGI